MVDCFPRSACSGGEGDSNAECRMQIGEQRLLSLLAMSDDERPEFIQGRYRGPNEAAVQTRKSIPLAWLAVAQAFEGAVQAVRDE